MKISSARILVVDDDPVMRKFVVNSLEKMGIPTIDSCEDGTQALQMVESFRPDVVLTDIHMTPMNGFEFVRQLREHRNVALRQVRIIFMSADSSTDTLE